MKTSPSAAFFSIIVSLVIILSAYTRIINRKENVCNGPTIFDSFLSSTECDEIVNFASLLGLRRSTVVQHGVDNSRTSTQVFLPHDSMQSIKLKSKIAKYLGVAVEKMEAVQVLRYETTQQYKPHFDSCDDGCDNGKNLDRTQTFFIYLSDVERGGETVFPNANAKVSPVKGRAVHWFNIDPVTKKNLPCSLHGGSPVKSGVKWCANIWIRL